MKKFVINPYILSTGSQLKPEDLEAAEFMNFVKSKVKT
jgi:hypothetical protein